MPPPCSPVSCAYVFSSIRVHILLYGRTQCANVKDYRYFVLLPTSAAVPELAAVVVCAAAATMTKTFRVQLNIIKKPYDRPVHFKVDGARFEAADKTVKFNVNAKYNFDFTFRPPQLLESVCTLT